MSKLVPKIARKIAQQTNAKGWDVPTLAKKSTVSERTINRILSSNVTPYNPSISVLEKLAKTFRMPISGLVDVRTAVTSVAQ